MSETINGKLRKNEIGRWEICDSSGTPLFELTCGDVFEIETPDGMRKTQMEATKGIYYTVEGFPLFEGLKAQRQGD
jgi:hypothetical protein